jgi:hypothetical protein
MPLILLCFYAQAAFAQDQTPNWSLEIDLKTLVTDKLRQVYVVDKDNRLQKLGPDGQFQFDFSNRYLGNLQNVDATDPFNVLLFYPDYQTLVILDRTLNMSADIRLDQETHPLPTLAAMGRDNFIWLYDAVLFRLRKMDVKRQIKAESLDLNQHFTRPINPSHLVVNETHAYLLEPREGILVFDLFGQFQKIIPLKNLEDLQTWDQYLLYRQAGQYFLLHPNGETAPFSVSDDPELLRGKPGFMVTWGGGVVKAFEE